MVIALSTVGQVSAGAYYATYSGLYVGVIEDGFELEQTYYTEPIRGDNLGDSIQDEIYRGGDCYFNFVLIEYLQALLAVGDDATYSGPIFHPHDPKAGEVGFPGLTRLQYAAQPLVLTEYVAITTSAPSVYTANKAVLASNFPVRILLANRLKRVPMRMIAYPQGVSGTAVTVSYTDMASVKWYDTTGGAGADDFDDAA